MTGSTQNTWNCYPFVSGTTLSPGTCSYSSTCSGTIGVNGYVNVAANESSLLTAVGITPVACAMDASTLQPYAGGIFMGAGCSSTNLNHAITVVGYGTTGGVPYWLVKNSWGNTWGQNGYFQLYRGNNTCGISNACAYPIAK